MTRKVLSPEEFGAMMRAEEAARPKPPPPPERKQAIVYAFRKFTHVISQAVYGMCYGDPEGYDAFLPADLAVEDLGIAARAALEASRFITPDHPEWSRIMRFPTKEETAAEDSRLKAQAGVKTLSALYNGAGMASLRMIDGRIEITPLRYRGSGHWEGIKGQQPVIVDAGSSEGVLGTAIKEAISVSRSA